MSEPDPILVASAADSGYAMPLAAMLRSVLAHRQPDRPVEFHLFDGGLSEADRRRVFDSCSEPGVTLRWIHPDRALLSGLPAWGSITVTTYFRLLLPSCLPAAAEKAIWLDADTIILRDIAGLWEQDTGQYALLAVQDLVVPYVSSTYGVEAYRELGLPGDAPYFNAGVMLVNLAYWRQHDVTAQVLSYLRRYCRQVWFYDQDGLNAVLAGRWGALDPRWNQIASVVGRRFLKAQHLSREEIRRLRDEPWIIHFAGHWKPWSGNSRAASHTLFFRHLDQTAWRGWRPARSWKSVLGTCYESRMRDHFYVLERLRMSLRRRLGAGRATGVA